jgi:hypothetical protein
MRDGSQEMRTQERFSNGEFVSGGVMTDEERQMLRQIHEALFSVPAGSAKDAKPLIESLRIMVRAYERGSWAVRALIWLLLTIAGVGTAIHQIKEWWQ